MKTSDEGDYEQLDELFGCIESTLCKALHDCDYHSIGRIYLETSQHYKNYDDFADNQTNEIEDTKIEYRVDFSTPLWSYNIWIECFCGQFEIKTDSLLPDMHQLLNLTLRASSSPAEHRIKTILQKYECFCKEFRGKYFRLSELLKALCDIYNLQYFFEGTPFDREFLQQSVGTLMDFLIEIGAYPVRTATEPTDQKWLYLLEYGCPTIEDGTNFSYGGLISPSRVLYRAVSRRSFANNAEAPGRYILSTYFPYSRTIEKISDGLYHTLWNH